MTDSPRRPEWAPPEGGDCFASTVRSGVDGGHDGLPQGGSRPAMAAPARRRELTLAEYIDGVRAGDRTTLARAISLVESRSAAHARLAQEVLHALLPDTGRSLRVGVTGVPGAGKSTFIEALGTHLTTQGHRVAVLAVDPSSTLSRGSVLGDKTRMEALARDPACFIRPSPTGGTLGGVAHKTREAMLLCEAAGFDVILVETVGVGQSEVTVRSMVDFFLLLLIAGAGDELQGIKKGVMELADAVVINKADGANRPAAEAARAETERALHYLAPATAGWRTRALAASALTREGVAGVWATVREFQALTLAAGGFERRRQAQRAAWVRSLVEEELIRRFDAHPGVAALWPAIEADVQAGRVTATAAVAALLRRYDAG